MRTPSPVNRPTSIPSGTTRRILHPGILSLLAVGLVITPVQAAEPAPTTPARDVGGDWTLAVDPDLPNVLLLGDSISVGYTRAVRAGLAGTANVFRPMRADGRSPDNCGNTRMGLDHLEHWLGDTHWDLIHFNWGLWDLCYRHPEATTPGNRDKVNGTLSVPIDEYRENLAQLAQRLKSTGATLIWASTTVVPQGEVGRFAGDEVKYNAIARDVMRAHDVVVNDLHALTAQLPRELAAGAGNVHFTSEGYDRIAAQVTTKIRSCLKAGAP